MMKLLKYLTAPLDLLYLIRTRCFLTHGEVQRVVELAKKAEEDRYREERLALSQAMFRCCRLQVKPGRAEWGISLTVAKDVLYLHPDAIVLTAASISSQVANALKAAKDREDQNREKQFPWAPIEYLKK